MAVLVEAISLVIRSDALLATFDDWHAFKQTVPNATLCADGELVRIGFMTAEDVQHSVQALESRGLRYIEAGEARDMVVVDQFRGPVGKCDWVEFGRIALDNAGKQQVAACRLAGSRSNTLMKPDGWTYQESLSRSYGFSSRQSGKDGLRFLRHESGIDVYWNELTGKEVFVGRTSDEPS
ncbi:MAG: hypothetical protein WD942_07600 [Dehalococcoidia bacterium]